MLVVPSLTQSCVWRLSDLCQCSRLSPRPELHPQDRGPSHCRETTPRSGLKDRVQNTGFLTCSDSNRLKGTNKQKKKEAKRETQNSSDWFSDRSSKAWCPKQSNCSEPGRSSFFKSRGLVINPSLVWTHLDMKLKWIKYLSTQHTGSPSNEPPSE